MLLLFYARPETGWHESLFPSTDLPDYLLAQLLL
jgi:hypothetical protein